MCYKDGPQLPPLNFTTTCTEHGRYVIFYNERLDGVTYPDGYEIQNVFTELCEVIVQGTEVKIIKCATILLANHVTLFLMPHRQLLKLWLFAADLLAIVNATMR